MIASNTTPYSNPSSPEVAPEAATGIYAADARAAEKRLGIAPNPSGVLPPVVFVKSDVLDHLQAAESWRVSSATHRSIDHFGAAESALKDVENQSLAKQGAQQAAAVLTNDTTISYVPSPAEAVLINFDKALMFWSLGDEDNAGLEFRRSKERTRLAVERYSAEISAAQAKNDQEAAVDQALQNPNTAKVIGDTEFSPAMSQWSSYSGFVIPAVTYTQALFESYKGDSSNISDAQNLLERVHQITPGNMGVSHDLEDLKTGNKPCPAQDCIWVLVEVGQGPLLREQKISLPLPLKGLPTGSIDMALPQLVPSEGAKKIALSAMVSGRSYELTEIGDMNSVIKTEFEKRYPSIVIRAVVSAALKAVAQQQAAQHGGVFGGFAASVISKNVTHADTRMWYEMPQGWALARIDHGIGLPLDIGLPSGRGTIGLPPWPALIYIKVPPRIGGEQPAPLIEVLRL